MENVHSTTVLLGVIALVVVVVDTLRRAVLGEASDSEGDAVSRQRYTLTEFVVPASVGRFDVRLLAPYNARPAEHVDGPANERRIIALISADPGRTTSFVDVRLLAPGGAGLREYVSRPAN